MLKHFTAFVLACAFMAAPAVAQNAGQIASVQKGKSCAGCNLFQADLAYRDGANMDLSKSRLRQSDLSLSTYSDVSFAATNLSIANLFGARFNRCNFKGADLSAATAVGTYFGSSNLSGANLTGANLSGADLNLAQGLSQTQLNRACGDASTLLPAGKTIPRCR